MPPFQLSHEPILDIIRILLYISAVITQTVKYLTVSALIVQESAFKGACTV